MAPLPPVGLSPAATATPASDSALAATTSTESTAPAPGGLGHALVIATTLARRDLKSRYTRSQLGAVLTILQPLLWLGTAVLAFWFLMRAGADRTTTGSWVVYATRTAAALAAWLPIAEAWGRAPSAFQAQAPLIRRTRFPFLAIPVSLVAAAQVTGLISLVIAVCLWPWEGPLDVGVFLKNALPGVALTALWAIAGAVVLSAVGVFFRDLTSLIGHLLTLGMLVTPIYYDPAIVPEAYRWAVLLNPLATPAGLLRTAVGGAAEPAAALCALYSAALGLLVLWIGLTLQKRLQPRIPEQL